MKFDELTISQANDGLQKREFSSTELTKFFLNKISDLDREIFSFVILAPEFALTQAKKVDQLILEGEKIPPLAGIPLAVKDNILVEGIRCTAASKILENYTAPYDATVIKKLREQGAVILGKTNLDEFAMGSSTENSALGTTKNPHDLTRVPGGSSGGSAAAVAAKFVMYALGSDTGGSIRQPASFSGVVGLKPTYGALSRYGLISMASSLDQIGPLAKTVEDAKFVFDTIKGKDPLDSTSFGLRGYSSEFKIKNFKIGFPKEYFIQGVDSGVEKITKNAINKFKEQGATIEEISLPHTEYALSVYYIIMPCEVSANLARYDGMRYGYSRQNQGDLLQVYERSRGEGFGEEARRRIMLGTYALSAGYYEAYYLKAQKVRTLIQRDFQEAFEKVDLILTPVSPTPAFRIGEKVRDPLKMYLSDIFTVAVSLAGLPALSVPAGKVGNLPVGLQMIAKPFQEEQLFQAGKFFEQISAAKEN